MAKVEAITAEVRKVLRDADRDQFDDADIHAWLYDAELVVVNFKLDALTKVANLNCQAGGRQTLDGLTPAAVRLLDVKRNVGGPPIVRLSRRKAEKLGFDWTGMTPSTVIKGFLEDERDPLAFETVPPAALGAVVEVLYVPRPTEYGTVTSTTETSVKETYKPALIEWALYRCFSEDTEGSANYARAGRHFQSFASILGVRLDNEIRTSPKQPRFDL